jgi:bifunctional enzyme CysN/CysC
MRGLRIVVAGHVDHGKSTILGRLLYDTGSLPQPLADKFDRAGAAQDTAAFASVTDQLSEEQEGSFTLDTAQAYLRTDQRVYTLVDTPGHRVFLRSMVTGTTQADAALLVVDAAEGPRAQTYLHAYLIAMLGIRQVIVAINKMDLVSYDRRQFEFLSHRLAGHLERIGIPPLAVIPVSAQQGDHVVQGSARMPWNAAPTVLEAIESLVDPEHRGEPPLRFLVQCPYPIQGRCALLGRVASGVLTTGQTITFRPGDHATTVVAILRGPGEIRTATAAQSVGLLLQEAMPVTRGHVGCHAANGPLVTDEFQARMFWISPQPLAVDSRIDVLCGTQSRRGHAARITRLIDPVSLETRPTDAGRVDDSQVAEIVVHTDLPMCIDPFDVVPELGRFAILQGDRITGGGVITG